MVCVTILRGLGKNPLDMHMRRQDDEVLPSAHQQSCVDDEPDWSYRRSALQAEAALDGELRSLTHVQCDVMA